MVWWLRAEFPSSYRICGVPLRKTHEKPEKVIMGEIAAIIRQITSSVSFLPLLDVPCKFLPDGMILSHHSFVPFTGSFDLLVYTQQKCNVPDTWEGKLCFQHRVCCPKWGVHQCPPTLLPF